MGGTKPHIITFNVILIVIIIIIIKTKVAAQYYVAVLAWHSIRCLLLAWSCE